jgi:hypothetical protein
MSTTTIESCSSTELKIVSLLEWWNDASEQQRLPLLDVRPHNEYHFSTTTPSSLSSTTATATIVHIPFTELEERSYELPPRHVVFALLIPDESSIALLQELLLGGGEKRRQKPWLVPYAILASDPDNWQQAKHLGLVKDLLPDTDTDTSTALPAAIQPCLCPFRAMPRLWEPDPMVAQVLLPILLQNATQIKDKDDSTFVETSEIWDLGAGSGRDVGFLAEQLRERLQPEPANTLLVVGLDQRYQETVAANEECARFWSRRGVGDMTACRRIRLEDWDEFSEELQRTNRQNSRVLCLFAVRFWNRPLVERLVSSPMIAPGTIFAISQFGKPSPDATWDFAHPKVRST